MYAGKFCRFNYLFIGNTRIEARNVVAHSTRQQFNCLRQIAYVPPDRVAVPLVIAGTVQTNRAAVRLPKPDKKFGKRAFA